MNNTDATSCKIKGYNIKGWHLRERPLLQKGTAPLLEMLIVIIIILIISALALHTYLKKPLIPGQTGAQQTPPQTIIDAAKQNVEKLNQRMSEYDKQLREIEGCQKTPKSPAKH